MKTRNAMEHMTVIKNKRGMQPACVVWAVLIGMFGAIGLPAMHANAQISKWEIDPGVSHLSFAGEQVGKNFQGEFHVFTADIRFAPTALADSSVIVEVDMSSAKTGERQRDLALRGEDWFSVTDFPIARFQADVFNDLGDGNYEAVGTLTIKDVTRPFTLPFHLQIDNKVAVMTSEVPLLRSNYNVGQGEWQTGDWVGLDVTVSIKLRALRV